MNPSENLKISYLKKAEDCLKSAKILYQNRLYENATAEAYYCMYNSLLALLFKAGIKSTNHAGSILVFKKLFGNSELAGVISKAKGERIDKQYHVEPGYAHSVGSGPCRKIITDAEHFMLRIRIIADGMRKEGIMLIRQGFSEICDQQ